MTIVSMSDLQPGEPEIIETHFERTGRPRDPYPFHALCRCGEMWIRAKRIEVVREIVGHRAKCVLRPKPSQEPSPISSAA
jgi:hypothetical protein